MHYFFFHLRRVMGNVRLWYTSPYCVLQAEALQVCWPASPPSTDHHHPFAGLLARPSGAAVTVWFCLHPGATLLHTSHQRALDSSGLTRSPPTGGNKGLRLRCRARSHAGSWRQSPGASILSEATQKDAAKFSCAPGESEHPDALPHTHGCGPLLWT